jgi:hypothetical protein
LPPGFCGKSEHHTLSQHLLEWHAAWNCYWLDTAQCREIVLPGQLTRFHVVEPLRPGALPGVSAVQRMTPVPGSDEALQQYIDGIRRGAPDYDRMTPEAAATAREQLPRHQSVDGTEGLFLGGGSSQNNYLLPQRQDLCLDRCSRPKQIDNRPDNEPDKISHYRSASSDSRSTASH